MTEPYITIRPDAIPALIPPPPEAPPRSLARNGVAMATGTLASRGTGFLRTVVIAAAIGEGGVGGAYAVANTVPNALYDLLLGGILSAVIVPLLVQAARDDGDNGEAYAQRLLTMVTVVLAGVAILAVAFAPQIIAIYAHPQQAQYDLAVAFARFFLPQLLFYGIGATFAAILNVRGSFVAPMWVPVINNVVVIATGIAFILITHVAPTPGHLTHNQLLILEVGTTLGVILQTVALLPALRRVGFTLRPRWDWRAAGFRRAGPFAAWMLGYVITNQLAYIVIVRLSESVADGHGVYAIYSNAYVLFSLPYAVIGVTVITALFPGMSRSGADGDDPAVAHTLSRGLSLAGVILVPATLVLVTLGKPIAVFVLQHGRTTPAQAHLTGQVLIAFAIGLVPFSAFQMQLRAWLAVRDSRTPALVNVWATGVNIVLDLALYVVLPTHYKAVGLALGYSLSYGVGAVIFTVKLRRRLVATERTHVIRTHVRLVLAAVIAAIPTLLITHLIGPEYQAKPLGALVTTVVAGGVAIAVFVVIARRLRINEIGQLMAMVPGVGR